MRRENRSVWRIVTKTQQRTQQLAPTCSALPVQHGWREDVSKMTVSSGAFVLRCRFPFFWNTASICSFTRRRRRRRVLLPLPFKLCPLLSHVSCVLPLLRVCSTLLCVLSPLALSLGAVARTFWLPARTCRGGRGGRARTRHAVLDVLGALQPDVRTIAAARRRDPRVVGFGHHQVDLPARTSGAPFVASRSCSVFQSRTAWPRSAERPPPPPPPVGSWMGGGSSPAPALARSRSHPTGNTPPAARRHTTSQQPCGALSTVLQKPSRPLAFAAAALLAPARSSPAAALPLPPADSAETSSSCHLQTPPPRRRAPPRGTTAGQQVLGLLRTKLCAAVLESRLTKK